MVLRVLEQGPGNRCKGRARSESGGTQWRTGGEVKGELANGVGSQYSHATSERGLSSITQADAHNSSASNRLNWRPHRFKWTRPFRGKTNSGFCACAITFRTSYKTGEGKTTSVCGEYEITTDTLFSCSETQWPRCQILSGKWLDVGLNEGTT